MTIDFLKPGDKIRLKNSSAPGKGLDRVVDYASGQWVVYTIPNDSQYAVDRSTYDRTFAKIPEFFEVGVTYRSNDDSIYGDFTPVAVERNDDGRLIAFGRNVVDGRTTWRSRGQLSYRYGDWRPV